MKAPGNVPINSLEDAGARESLTPHSLCLRRHKAAEGAQKEKKQILPPPAPPRPGVCSPALLGTGAGSPSASPASQVLLGKTPQRGGLTLGVVSSGLAEMNLAEVRCRQPYILGTWDGHETHVHTNHLKSWRVTPDTGVQGPHRLDKQTSQSRSLAGNLLS